MVRETEGASYRGCALGQRGALVRAGGAVVPGRAGSAAAVRLRRGQCGAHGAEEQARATSAQERIREPGSGGLEHHSSFPVGREESRSGGGRDVTDTLLNSNQLPIQQNIAVERRPLWM
ncbi:hypothetical protein MHYP_G00165880 [Metynnis hypsauchen]